MATISVAARKPIRAHTYYTLSVRTFAKRGIYRGRRRKLRHSKPGLPRREDRAPVDVSKTRTLSGQPWGPPRYPIPRVETTSVEYAQNLNSLCQIVEHKIQCLGLAVSSYNHASKAAVERMDAYCMEIAQSTPYLHLYQLIIVDDILGYSRDIGSRNTLWIPNDFTVKELIKYLQEECINDPKLCEIRRMDSFLNPFQPNNWNTVDNLARMDGAMFYEANNFRNPSQSRRMPVPRNEYREVEPLELVKLREKARNFTFDEEQYIDSSDFFNYWHVPDKQKMDEPQGTDPKVPPYVISEKSRDDQIEMKSYLQQIDETEKKLNAKLLERKQWFLENMEKYQSELEQAEEVDDEELEKVDSLLTDEFEADESVSFEVSRHRQDVGQHLKFEIQGKASDENLNMSDEMSSDSERCPIHFPQKSNK